MKNLFILFCTLTMFKTNAQEVQSTAYKLMLNTLLSHSVPEISVTKVDSDNNTVWLDARGKEEFEVSKIRDAKWVGYDDFSMSRVEGISKEEEIIVYCSVGYRSEKISEKLIAAGYTNVSNLYGGIFEWRNEENIVVDSDNRETNKVHGFSKMWGIWLNKGEKVY